MMATAATTPLSGSSNRGPEDVIQRLQGMLEGSIQLVACAAAVHRTPEGEHSRRVWLTVGKTRSQEHCVVFLFSRTRLPCCKRLREFVYCVLPVVSNMALDIKDDCCVFRWSQRHQHSNNIGSEFSARSSVRGAREVRELQGDCTLADIRDTCGVLELLQDGYMRSCQLGLTFHEEQRHNHRELWAYRDAIPLELAKLPPVRLLAGQCHATKSLFTPRASRNIRVVSTLSMPDIQHVALVCITWNVGGTSPRSEEEHSLAGLLREQRDADIICLGLQEVCELSAKRVVLDGEEWLGWKSWSEDSVREVYGGELEFLHAAHLVGLLTVVFARQWCVEQISNVCHCGTPTGVGGVGGNKGAVSIRFELGMTSLCFVNAHLAAGQAHYIERCCHYRTIVDKTRFDVSSFGRARTRTSSGDRTAPRARPGAQTRGVRTPKTGSPPSSKEKPLLPMRSSSPAEREHHEIDAGRLQSTSLAEEVSRSRFSDTLETVFNVRNLFSRAASQASLGPETTSSRGSRSGLELGERKGGKLGPPMGSKQLQDHDHIFWLGDTNSRLHWPGKLGGMPVQEAARKLQSRNIGQLLALDQLNLMRQERMAFEGFEEMPIFFLPTYKWVPDGDALDTRLQKHVPAWTDRILYRSMTKQSVRARCYDAHLGLRQSDHRMVFARFGLPVEVDSPKDDSFDFSEAGVGCGFVDFVDLVAEPAELHLPRLKPAWPCESKVCVVLNKASGYSTGGSESSRSRHFKVLLATSSGAELELPGGGAVCRPEDDSFLAPGGEVGAFPAAFAAAWSGAPPERRTAPSLLARSLSVTPAEGILEQAEPLDLVLAVNVQEAVLKAEDLEGVLVLRLWCDNKSEAARDVHLTTLRVTLEPSVLFVSLHTLATLGDTALLPPGGGESVKGSSSTRAVSGERSKEAEATRISKFARRRSSGFATELKVIREVGDDTKWPRPPKEPMAAMEWLEHCSCQATPGSFDWWPDPLLDGSKNAEEDIREFQGQLEKGVPLSRDEPLFSPRCATLFLIRWSSLLPEPLLELVDSDPANEIADDAAQVVLPPRDPLARSVLACIISLFARIMLRHGERTDVVPRLAAAFARPAPLGGQARRGGPAAVSRPAPPKVQDFLQQLLDEFKFLCIWPPGEAQLPAILTTSSRRLDSSA